MQVQWGFINTPDVFLMLSSHLFRISFSFHLVIRFLVLTQAAATVPAPVGGGGGRHLLCVSLCVFIPTVTLSIQVSPGVGLASLWEGRELRSYNRCLGSPPKLLQQPQSQVQGPGTFPWASKISLPSVFKCPLQSLASKLHISWDSVGCSEDWRGVQLGA